MRLYRVFCSQCNKVIFRDKRRINEAKKFGWKTYCSLGCQKKVKNQQTFHRCSRPGCNKKFKRQPNEIKKFKQLYCSRSCAATVNNSKYPKNPGVRKKCKYCGRYFVSREKYCSRKCKDRDSVITEAEILQQIKGFYRANSRIPFKREFTHYHAARERFGTWNNAVESAGFDPNPVMFAKKYIANDGHKCDSLSEKIIDDWLCARKIEHEINYPYPGNEGFTADFKVGDYWIEFFGLSGQHKRYDELKLKKINLAKIHSLKILEIYPDDIFPDSRLDKILQKF